jgi:UPF0755 protein
MPENPSSDASPPTSRRQARAARGAGTEPALTHPQSPPQPVRPAALPPRSTAATARPTGAPGAAPTGTLDELFTGERGTDELGSVPKKSRRRRAGGWVAAVIVLALIGGVVAGGIWVWNEFGTRISDIFAEPTVDDFESGMANGEASITIVQGDAGQSVSQKMFDAGVTKTATSLYDYMVQNDVVFTFQPGVFRLQLQMTSPAALEALDNPANRLENRAQLREGLTVDQSLQTISEQMSIPLEELQAAAADPAAYGVAARSLEGWLFPATYDFDPDTPAADIIRRMVDRTVQSLDAAAVPVDQRERILTIASIIEREGRTPDFGKVSRVIQNRLDQGMKLQMDSTSQYGYGELHAGSVSTSQEAQFDDNEWNTYVIDGLPATPIANPGDAAIAAAMAPEEGPWLFFVTVNLDTGETVFSTTADEHEVARQQWIAWCQDHPDSGC